MYARALRRSLSLVFVAMAASCTRVIVEPPAASIGAQLSVERFLLASNTRDVRAMGQLFGTSDGPLGDTGGTLGCAFKRIGSWFGGMRCRTREEVEIRMDAIASVLTHSDYRVLSEQRVAGRSAPTRQVLVHLTTSDGVEVPDLPFVVVQTEEGRWLIEQVDLQRVMAAR